MVTTMEYQFRRDIAGQPEALFSMNHEAMGIWLTNELGTNSHRLKTLMTAIDRLLNKELWEYEHEGHDYQLVLTRNQAEVKAALLDSEMYSDEMEDMDYYDSESSCHCGLNDFKAMILSWQEFITH